jgi:hypothetical protein
MKISNQNTHSQNNKLTNEFGNELMNNQKSINSEIDTKKFIITVVIFITMFVLIQRRNDHLSLSLRKIVVKSFFIYFIKSILTKFLLDDANKNLLGKRNIINILISVITISLFLLFDESDILI